MTHFIRYGNFEIVVPDDDLSDIVIFSNELYKELGIFNSMSCSMDYDGR